MIHEAYRYIRARHPVSGAVRWSIGPLRASFGWAFDRWVDGWQNGYLTGVWRWDGRRWRVEHAELAAPGAAPP